MLRQARTFMLFRWCCSGNIWRWLLCLPGYQTPSNNA